MLIISMLYVYLGASLLGVVIIFYLPAEILANLFFDCFSNYDVILNF